MRATFAPPQSIEMREVTAREIVRLDGEVVRMDPGRVVLSAFWVESSGGFEQPAGGATVSVPIESVARIQRKELDLVRTGGLIGVGLAASYFVFDAVFDFGGGGGRGGGSTFPD